MNDLSIEYFERSIESNRILLQRLRKDHKIRVLRGYFERWRVTVFTYCDEIALDIARINEIKFRKQKSFRRWYMRTKYQLQEYNGLKVAYRFNVCSVKVYALTRLRTFSYKESYSSSKAVKLELFLIKRNVKLLYSYAKWWRLLVNHNLHLKRRKWTLWLRLYRCVYWLRRFTINIQKDALLRWKRRSKWFLVIPTSHRLQFKRYYRRFFRWHLLRLHLIKCERKALLQRWKRQWDIFHRKTKEIKHSKLQYKIKYDISCKYHLRKLFQLFQQILKYYIKISKLTEKFRHYQSYFVKRFISNCRMLKSTRSSKLLSKIYLSNRKKKKFMLVLRIRCKYHHKDQKVVQTIKTQVYLKYFPIFRYRILAMISAKVAMRRYVAYSNNTKVRKAFLTLSLKRLTHLDSSHIRQSSIIQMSQPVHRLFHRFRQLYLKALRIRKADAKASYHGREKSPIGRWKSWVRSRLLYRYETKSISKLKSLKGRLHFAKVKFRQFVDSLSTIVSTRHHQRKCVSHAYNHHRQDNFEYSLLKLMYICKFRRKCVLIPKLHRLQSAFHRWIEYDISHRKMMLSLSRGHLRYITNQTTYALLKLRLYTVRRATLDRSFRVYRKLHHIPFAMKTSILRRIFNAWKTRYESKTKKWKRIGEYFDLKTERLYWDIWFSSILRRRNVSRLIKRWSDNTRMFSYFWKHIQNHYKYRHKQICDFSVTNYTDFSDRIDSHMTANVSLLSVIDSFKGFGRFAKFIHASMTASSLKAFMYKCYLRRRFYEWIRYCERSRFHLRQCRQMYAISIYTVSRYQVLRGTMKKRCLLNIFSRWCNYHESKRSAMRTILLKIIGVRYMLYWKESYRSTFIRKNLLQTSNMSSSRFTLRPHSSFISSNISVQSSTRRDGNNRRKKLLEPSKLLQEKSQSVFQRLQRKKPVDDIKLIGNVSVIPIQIHPVAKALSRHKRHHISFDSTNSFTLSDSNICQPFDMDINQNLRSNRNILNKNDESHPRGQFKPDECTSDLRDSSASLTNVDMSSKPMLSMSLRQKLQSKRDCTIDNLNNIHQKSSSFIISDNKITSGKSLRNIKPNSRSDYSSMIDDSSEPNSYTSLYLKKSKIIDDY